MEEATYSWMVAHVLIIRNDISLSRSDIFPNPSIAKYLTIPGRGCPFWCRCTNSVAESAFFFFPLPVPQNYLARQYPAPSSHSDILTGSLQTIRSTRWLLLALYAFFLQETNWLGSIEKKLDVLKGRRKCTILSPLMPRLKT